MNIKLIIDEDIKNLIPPLQPSEYEELENLIEKHGCQMPLIYWHKDSFPCRCGGLLMEEAYDIEVYSNEWEKWVTEDAYLYKCFDCCEQLDISEVEFTLLDGHNRLEICQRLGKDYDVIPMQFDRLDDVKLWVLNNQDGRRNVSDGWKYQSAQMKREILLEIGKTNQGMRTDILSTVDKKLEPHNTQKIVADSLGWSTGKVAMADKVWKTAAPEIKEKVLANEISINEAYQGLKKNTHVANNSGENEWYTPKVFIEAARKTMGSIDLDPASSELANETVKAAVFYSKEDNGLEKPWPGTVFCNPPYAQPLINQFAEKLIAEFNNFDQAIVLVNNATETKWFQTLASRSSAICFPASRIKFNDKSGNPTGAPLQGQAILYYGVELDKFMENFDELGLILYNDV